jgi:hypothetical protein
MTETAQLGCVRRTLAEISQRQSFAEDSVPDQRAKGTLDHHLNRPLEYLFQIRDETTGEPRSVPPVTSMRRSISLFGVSSPRHRTQQPHVSSTVTRRHTQDFFAPLLNLFAEAHSLQFNASADSCLGIFLKGVSR